MSKAVRTRTSTPPSKKIKNAKTQIFIGLEWKNWWQPKAWRIENPVKHLKWSKKAPFIFGRVLNISISILWNLFLFLGNFHMISKNTLCLPPKFPDFGKNFSWICREHVHLTIKQVKNSKTSVKTQKKCFYFVFVWS